MSSSDNTIRLNFEAVANFSNVINNVKQVQSALRNIKMPEKIGTTLEKNITGVITSMEKLQGMSKKGFTKPGEVSAYEKELQKADTMLNKMVRDLGKLSGKDLLKLNIDTSQINQLKQQFDNIKKQMTTNVKGAMLSPTIDLKGSFSGMDQLLKKGTQTRQIYNNIVDAINKGNFSKAESEWTKLNTYMDRYNSKKLDDSRWLSFKEKMVTALQAGGREVEKLIPELDKLERETKEATNLQEGNINNVLEHAKNTASSTADQFGVLRKKEEEAAAGLLTMNQQMNQLKTQANYFFGLQNMFQLLKRGIRDAVETIKELDASMTETAVVTDFSVADMWKMLPEYTKSANELGSTINDVYQAATLYYQQGLNQDQAMGLANETLKMARIGGLEAAEATDMMTAALRGFNMELNEASGKRINDVYSNLAAKTASDTRELGEAMERTASIAHSANMEFETTAAFLANMIETTREAPENLGTAMKTIVARFQELKENPYGISEVEGEEVNYNRVDKALKTIGVDLMDSRDKFRDLDDVFIDISEKWEGLSQTQQRYIATIAAGSRQQSRFIAMVSNYKRTMELVNYANNSAGASNVQFAKTLDSMSAKLNEFKNAWDLFIMGIANNNFVKGAVDFGTKVITIIDKVIDGISKFTGPLKNVTKSVLSLSTAFLGLKVAGRFINSGLGLLGRAIDPSIKGGFFAGATGRAQERKSAAVQPIVSVLERIYAAMPKKTDNKSFTNALAKGEFRSRENQIRDILGGKGQPILGENGKEVPLKKDSYAFGSVGNAMQGMSAEQQGYILKTNPSLKKNLNNALYKTLTEGKTLDTTGKLINKGITRSIIKNAEAGNGIQVSDLLTMGQKNSRGKYTKAAMESQRRFTEALISTSPTYAQKYEEAYLAERAKVVDRIATKKGFSKKEAESFINSNEKIGEHISKRAKINVGKNFQAQNMATPQQITLTDKLAQGFGRIGSSAAGAGMAMQSFGMALSNAGLPTMGSVVASLGSGFSALGMAVSSVGTALTAIGAGPLIAITVAIAGITALIVKGQKHVKDIRKDAKDIVKEHEKINEATQKNITTLEDYRADFARLSKGVDENGNNVSLGTEEYKDYLKIVNDLVQMNPSLIKGYNAQGNAIIDNNKAIEETLKLQKDQQQLVNENYIGETSLQKLVDARNTYKRFKRNQISYGQTDAGNRQGMATEQPKRLEYYGDYIQSLKDISKNDKELANELQKALSDYGIDWDNLTEDSVRILENQGANIEATVGDLMHAHDVSSEQITNSSKTLAKAAKESKAFKESYKDVYDNLLAYASEKNLMTGLDSSATFYYQQAIDQIASSQDLNASEMQAQVRQIGDRFQEAQNKIGDTFKDTVDTAQENFIKNLDASEYEEAIQPAIKKLADLAEEAEKTGDSTSKAIAEMYRAQIKGIQDFSKETDLTLPEAFNTETTGIEAANKAYEAFQKNTENGDFYTGIDENMKKIYDDIMDGIDNKGQGSMTFWKGAESLLGRENIEGKSFAKVKKQVEALKDELQQGKEGADAFFNRITQGKVQSKILPEDLFGKGKTVGDFFKFNSATGKLDIDIPFEAGSEKFEALANAMGLSTDALISQLNRAKQFYDISFTDYNQLRTAIATSESTVTGTGKTGEYTNVWTTESSFRNEAENANLRPNEIEEAIVNAEKRGVKLVKDSDEIKKKDIQSYIKDWSGESKTNTRNFIEYFDKLGFSKDEIEGLYDKYGEDVITKSSLNKDSFEDSYANVQEAVPAELAETADSTAQTANNTEQLVNLMGGLTKEQQQEIQGYTENTENKESAINQFSTISGITSQESFDTTKDSLTEEYNRIVELKQTIDAALKQNPNDENLKAQADALDAAEEKYNTAIEKGQAAWDKLKEQMTVPENGDINKTAENFASYIAEKGYNKKETQELGREFVGENVGLFANMNDEDFAKVISNFNLAEKEVAKLRQQFDMPFRFKVQEGDKLKEFINNYKGLGKGVKKNIYLNAQLSGSEKVTKIIDTLSGGDNIKKDILIDVATKYKEGDAEGAHEILTGAKDKDGNPIFGSGETERIEKNMEIIASGTIVNKADFEKSLQESLKGGVDGAAKEAGVTIEAKAKVTDAEVSGDAANVETKGTVKYTNSTMAKKAQPLPQNAIINYNKIGKQIKPKDQTAKVNYTRGSQDPPKSPQTATVNYTASLGKGKSSQDFRLTVSKAAKGLNNVIHKTAIPAFGSLAKGTKGYQKKTQFGRVGPNGKGGPTLTGEEGYEIGWIPSENRAMILGADGPQVVDLPKEAVVWTHKQSEKIIKQKGIPMGSHKATGKVDVNPGGGGDPGNGSGGGSSRNSNKSGSGKNKSSSGKNKDKEKEIKRRGKLSVYVYNMEKKIEEIERKIEKTQKKINKALEKASTTLKDITSEGNKYISYLNKEKSLNNDLFNYYNKLLKKLDKGSKKKKEQTTIQWTNETKKYKKGKGGKWKYNGKGSQKHSAKVNLGAYIKQDPSTGAYVIDQAAINRVAKKDKNKAKAIRDKAKEKIDEYTSGRNTAEDKMNDAQDKLEEFAKQLYDTFYGWENELTKVLNLTQQVTDLQKKREQSEKVSQMRSALLESGMRKASDSFIKQSLQLYKYQLKTQLDEIKKRNKLIEGQREKIENLRTTKDEQARLKTVKARLSKNGTYETQQKKVDQAQAKYNKANNTVKKYNDNKKKAQNLKKDVLGAKTKKKLENKVNKLEKKQKSGKLTKKEKEELKRAKTKLSADKKARKFLKKNSTKSLTKKNYNDAKKEVKDQKKLEAKKKKAQATINKLSKKKKLSKAEKEQLAKAKKNLKDAKAGLAKNAKAQKIINAYEAKNNLNNLKTKLNNAKAQLNTNNKLSATEKAALQEEQRQLEERIKNTKTAQTYIETNKNTDGTISIDINYKKLEEDKGKGLISEELYNFIKDYYDELIDNNEELIDTYNEQIEAIEEMSSTLRDLQEAYADRSEELLNAYEELQQSQIDRLDKINKSLSDALKDLLDEVKRRLDQRRQQEDNAKTEEDISQKQQRLAALRADSSGSNAKAIKQLEKEIAEAQQGYTRTLEDQTLQRMQDEADKAEQQRQKQIDLLSAQLEYQKQTGVLAAQINEWLAHPDDYANIIESTWMSNKDLQSQTDARKTTIAADFETFKADIASNGLPAKINEQKKTIEEALTATNDILQKIYDSMSGEEKSANGTAGNTGGNTAPKSGTGVAPKSGTGVLGNTAPKLASTLGSAVISEIGNGIFGDKTKKSNAEAYKTSMKGFVKDKKLTGAELTKLIQIADSAGYGTRQVLQDLANTKELGWDDVLKAYIKYRGSKSKAEKSIRNWWGTKGATAARKKGFKEAFGKKYATGGLATSTGPAWLDGTKSKPELVLNAQDTKNFLALKDTLSKAVSGTKGIVNDMNMTYDIDINVDHISSDYDVDQIANRIQKKIIQSAGYRNVNAVRNLR